MAGNKDEAKEVVFDVVRFGDVEIRHGGILLRFEFASELLVLAFEKLVTAEMIDGAVLGGGHQPGAGIVGDAGGGPFFQGGDQGVLRELFGNADISDDASQARNQSSGFD